MLALLGAAFGVWLSLRPVPVGVHVVSKQTVVAEVMGTGTLEARVGATIGSKIAGRIESIPVDQGDRVEPGQVLLRLDDADLSRQVDVARADHAAAEAVVQRALADKVRSEAVLAAARRELARIRELASKSVVSQAEADAAQDSVQIAEAGLGAARAAVTEAEGRVTASARSLDYQAALLTETVIKAPFAGLITRRHREQGDVLVPGSPVLTLISTEELWVSAWVDETEMGRLAAGQKARVEFRSHPGREYGGAVARLGREVDRETREFVVDVRVDDLPQNWAIGQRTEVFVAVGRAEEALAVPARLIRREQGAPGVFVREGDRARWREVTLGIRGRGLVQVAEGLREGDEVLEAGAARALEDGARVVLSP
ncbi:MAG: efflux RND transporter periplasmic adaptor subunit [Planctomycetes bacterium]|nr:efflux RND transporter periplasmic adaptor subunit [Planctomycetota bacterium]